MKFKLRWMATYETEIEAPDENSARDEASSVEVDVPGSRYIDDSWEVVSMVPVAG